MRLAITGVPGWFTDAFLESLRREPIAKFDSILALVRKDLFQNERLRAAHAAVTDWKPYELGEPASFREAFSACDSVVHAAGVIHVKKPEEWFRINTSGTIALAAAAKASGVKRFVFLSSNAAGGACNSAEDVLTEEVPAKPLSAYGESKWLAEKALLAMHVPGAFEVVILRPSMFYGPPVPQRHVDIYKRLTTGTMPLVGDGHFRRSVTHIDNLVQGARLALERPEAAGQTYYIVDDEVYTTKSIVEAMAEALGVRPRFLRLPRVVGPIAYQLDRMLLRIGMYSTPLHLVGESHWHVAVSSAKATRELGYRPTVSLGDGMRQAVTWCREKGKL